MTPRAGARIRPAVAAEPPDAGPPPPEPPDGGTPEPGVPPPPEPPGPSAIGFAENPWILYWFVSLKAPMLLDVIDLHITRRLESLRQR